MIRRRFGTPELDPETPVEPGATHEEVVRRLSAPIKPQRPAPESLLTPGPYGSPPDDPWVPDVPSLIAKVSM